MTRSTFPSTPGTPPLPDIPEPAQPLASAANPPADPPSPTTKGELTVLYTNWRSATVRVHWGNNEWHREPQWLREAWDYDKNAVRDFALKDCDFASRVPVAGNEQALVDAAMKAMSRLMGSVDPKDMEVHEALVNALGPYYGEPRSVPTGGNQYRQAGEALAGTLRAHLDRAAQGWHLQAGPLREALTEYETALSAAPSMPSRGTLDAETEAFIASIPDVRP